MSKLTEANAALERRNREIKNVEALLRRVQRSNDRMGLAIHNALEMLCADDGADVLGAIEELEGAE